MGKTLIQYEQGELYERLVDEYEVFDHYYEVLVFLAVVGYREDRVKRSGYKGDTQAGTNSEAGLQNVHSRDLFHTVAACLAFQDTGDPEALVDTQEHKRVIAQYAAGGLEFAREEFGQTAGDPTDAIVNYIKDRSEEDDDETIEGELQEIVDAFDDEMMGYESE
jgi:dnd system-associated protein 4